MMISEVSDGKASIYAGVQARGSEASGPPYFAFQL